MSQILHTYRSLFLPVCAKKPITNVSLKTHKLPQNEQMPWDIQRISGICKNKIKDIIIKYDDSKRKVASLVMCKVFVSIVYHTRIKDARNHARNDDQPQWKKLEVSSHDAASFSM